MTAAITGSGAALPAPMDQQALWDGFFREHYRDDPVARAIWRRCGVERRHGVGGLRVRHLAERLPRGGILHGDGPAALAIAPLAPDVELLGDGVYDRLLVCRERHLPLASLQRTGIRVAAIATID